MTDQTNGLTEAEHRAIELTAELWNLVAGEVMGNGPSRDQDTAEFAILVHAVQSRIMGQAAARAHPELYRLLGEVLA